MGDVEDLDYNPFFSGLQKKFPRLYDKAQEACYLICVPHSHSLPAGFKPTQAVFEKHIFSPSPYFKNEYESLSKPTMKVRTQEQQHHLLLTLPPGDKTVDVRILSEETFYNKAFQPFRVLCIESMLSGDVVSGGGANGSTAGSSASLLSTGSAGGATLHGTHSFSPSSSSSSFMGSGAGLGGVSMASSSSSGGGGGGGGGGNGAAGGNGVGIFEERSTFEEHEKFLATYTRALRPLAEMAKVFNETYVVVDGYLDHLAERLMTIRDEVRDIALTSPDLASVRSDPRLHNLLSDAIECCLFQRVYEKTYKAVLKQNEKQDAELVAAQRKAAYLSQQDYGSSLKGACDLEAACAALRSVVREKTPLTKFVVLRNVLTFISEAAKRSSPAGFVLAADDLLPLLSATMAQAQCPDLCSHLEFLDRFGWTPKTSAEYPYVLVTMQAALANLLSVAATMPASKSPPSAVVGAGSVVGGASVLMNSGVGSASALHSGSGLERSASGTRFDAAQSRSPVLGLVGPTARLTVSSEDLSNSFSTYSTAATDSSHGFPKATPPPRRSSMVASTPYFSGGGGTSAASGGGGGGGAGTGDVLSRAGDHGDQGVSGGKVTASSYSTSSSSAASSKKTSTSDASRNPSSSTPSSSSSSSSTSSSARGGSGTPGRAASASSSSTSSTTGAGAGTAPAPAPAPAAPVPGARTINLAPLNKPKVVTEKDMGSLLTGFSWGNF